MSYFDSEPLAGGDARPDADHGLPFADRWPPSLLKADRTIDSALRSVPLPAGLLTRLSMLVYTMPDEAADQVDYLGC